MRNVERAKRIAADKGVNISFVCREIGKSRGYISQMLTTDRDFPDEMLLPVANALGVTVEELTGNQKENPPQQSQSEVDADIKWIEQKLVEMSKEKREALMKLIKTM
nr:MAG TPA: helix-turn-helix domain protein [Caudoviricetes sp.]